jgi:NitT/TauT family transport system substrate-binding protein
MGAGRLWIANSEIIPQFPISAVIFGPSILEDNPEAGVRFMVAYLKAVRQFQEQGKSERNLEIISEFTGVSIEELKDVCWTSFRVDGSMNLDAIEDFSRWAVAKGYVATAPGIDQVWDPQFIDAANAILNK